MTHFQEYPFRKEYEVYTSQKLAFLLPSIRLHLYKILNLLILSAYFGMSEMTSLYLSTLQKNNFTGHSMMKNLLLESVEYQITETPLGVWRRFVYPNGDLFEEFMTRKQLMGLPLIHYTRGKCPETGKRIIAKGIIAIGRLAVGGIAVGHASAGLISIGQLAVGMVFGLGQASTGVYAVGQLAIAYLFGIGQFATGLTAIGQFGLGKYVLAQFGIGEYVWDMRGAAPEAIKFFRALMPFR